jgi:chorismate mutase/prephenate dehydratase
MAKRTTSSRSTSSQTLRDLKRKADKLNRDLVRLLNEYARCHERLVRLRLKDGLPPSEQESDSHVLQQALATNKGPLSDHVVTAVVRELRSAVRASSKPVRVAYLGPTYSYSHLAAIERFGTSSTLVPVSTIAAVFEEINRAHADFGIVPIENSTDGRVVDTLCMFMRLPAKICGEVQLRIHHYLLAKCDRNEIQEVYSKPQALSQCREWLARHLPLARTVEMTSTAAAAQLAAEKHGAAAIASYQAAVNYGLSVVAEQVEDNRNNVTRFAVIGDHPGERTGNDKTAAMFEIAHLPGALADAINIFKRSRLNLTWIESFPMPNSESEYLFFVELEGHQEDTKVKRALETLARKTERLEILGSYSRSPPLESR